MFHVVVVYPVPAFVPDNCQKGEGLFEGQSWTLILSSVKLRSEESLVSGCLMALAEALELGRSAGGKDLLTNKFICKADTNSEGRKSLCLVSRSPRRYRDERTKSYTRETGPK